MKKIFFLLLFCTALAAGAYYILDQKTAGPQFKTAKVERGDIAATVSATGNLVAVVNVQVGTQVSGTIRELFADFNSLVKAGQPIAQIDPALFKAQVEQARGNLLAAEANVEKAKVARAEAKRTLDRNLRLKRDNTIAQNDLDVAQTNFDASLAGVKAAEAAVVQTRGAYILATTNLEYTTIRSPVEGIVVSRNVNVGQTVAASFQTPTLFNIAQDLTRMQIETSVDEADIGSVKEGQVALFGVDAYPDSRFEGRVTQVRNAAVVAQNVVTYVVVIDIDNPDLRLKPGMTANVTFKVNEKRGILKIPKAALRFRPRAADGRRGPEESAKSHQDGKKRVFVLSAEGQPKPMPVKTGIGNDKFVELVEGKLAEDAELIVEQISAAKKASLFGAPTGAGPGPRL